MYLRAFHAQDFLVGKLLVLLCAFPAVRSEMLPALVGSVFPNAVEEVRTATVQFLKAPGSYAPQRWSDTCNGWLPILVFIPEMKCGFLKQNDAAKQVYCNKPVLPAWSLGADPC